jgi:hypothetical protein
MKALQLDTISSLVKDFIPYALAIPSDRLSSAGRNIQVNVTVSKLCGCCWVCLSVMRVDIPCCHTTGDVSGLDDI